MQRKQKILIVDDRKEVRQLIKMALRHTTYDLIEATNGEQGLEILRTNRPNLVFLDIVMPGGIDGFAVCRAIKKETDLAAITRCNHDGNGTNLRYQRRESCRCRLLSGQAILDQQPVPSG